MVHRAVQADSHQPVKYHRDNPSVALKEHKKTVCLQGEKQGLYMVPVHPENLACVMQSKSVMHFLFLTAFRTCRFGHSVKSVTFFESRCQLRKLFLLVTSDLKITWVSVKT